jgi:hypothetical protein
VGVFATRAVISSHLSSTPIEKTLMQTLACQHSCNSCSRLTGTCELRKLSCKLSLLNSHQLLFSFDRNMRVEKTLMQTLACQHSCNSCSRLTGTCKLRKFSCKLSLADSHQLSLSLTRTFPQSVYTDVIPRFKRRLFVGKFVRKLVSS